MSIKANQFSTLKNIEEATMMGLTRVDNAKIQQIIDKWPANSLGKTVTYGNATAGDRTRHQSHMEASKQSMQLKHF